MRSSIISAVALLTLVLLIGIASVWRWLHVLPYPMGGGQFLDSPNHRYEARASDMHDQDFWGYKRNYYEFSVVRKGKLDPIKEVRMDYLPGEQPFPMRSDKRIISWADDSKAATFRFQGIELKMILEPRTGP